MLVYAAVLEYSKVTLVSWAGNMAHPPGTAFESFMGLTSTRASVGLTPYVADDDGKSLS